MDLPEQVKESPHRLSHHWIRLLITVTRSVRRPAAAQDVVAARMWESKGGQEQDASIIVELGNYYIII